MERDSEWTKEDMVNVIVKLRTEVEYLREAVDSLELRVGILENTSEQS